MYFDTYSSALEAAKADARTRGFCVIESQMLLPPVGYGETVRLSFDLLKDNKPQRKALQVILYRMDSGKYELTHYIN